MNWKMNMVFKMENTKEHVTVNVLINDMKKINESFKKSRELKQKIIDIAKERVAEKERFKTLGKLISETSKKLDKAMKQARVKKIPDKIIIHMDFQVW